MVETLKLPTPRAYSYSDRSYHDPHGDPCTLCGLSRSRHWVRHYRGCDCGCHHRDPTQHDTRHRTRLDRKYWVGVDGEGLGRAPHRYVYLAYSDAAGRHTDSIRDSKGLSTIACLEFLLSIPGDARVAGYYLGYDWTMIFRDMPRKAIYDLLRPELRYLGTDEGGQCRPIRWRGYKIQYMARTVRIKKGDHSVTIWDVGPFFQSSFVKALEDWGISQSQIDAIKRMKDKRSQFTADDDIESYCLSECRLLAQLSQELDNAHREAGLPLRSYHGPGATANVALKTMGIRKKRGKIPRQVHESAKRAFFGGRFEHSCIGPIGDCDGLDIVSAYPFQAYNLPCLEHGVWEHTTRESEVTSNSVVKYAISDSGDDSWGALPCRLADGSIVFPRGGFTGYAWGKEYLEATRYWKNIHFHDAWVLYSDCNCKPFQQILEWFKERERIGKDGKGRILKLALNSIYGKLAQSVGKPQYRSIVWAGMITSGTRARLLEIIGPNKDSIAAAATDGLYATSAVSTPEAPLAPCRLGSWERKQHENMVLVRPGIYWSDDQLKARGLGTKQLKSYRSRVMYAIKKGLPEARVGKAPIFMAARQSVYKRPNGTLKRNKLYGEWFDRPVRIRLTPLPKRNPDWSLRMLDNVESVPYGTLSPDSKRMKLLEDILWGQPS